MTAGDHVIHPASHQPLPRSTTVEVLINSNDYFSQMARMDDCVMSFDEAIRFIGEVLPFLGDTDSSPEFKDIVKARDLKSHCHQLSTEREQCIKDDIIGWCLKCRQRDHACNVSLLCLLLILINKTSAVSI